MAARHCATERGVMWRISTSPKRGSTLPVVAVAVDRFLPPGARGRRPARPGRRLPACWSRPRHRDAPRPVDDHLRPHELRHGPRPASQAPADTIGVEEADAHVLADRAVLRTVATDVDTRLAPVSSRHRPSTSSPAKSQASLHRVGLICHLPVNCRNRDCSPEIRRWETRADSSRRRGTRAPGPTGAQRGPSAGTRAALNVRRVQRSPESRRADSNR